MAQETGIRMEQITPVKVEWNLKGTSGTSGLYFYKKKPQAWQYTRLPVKCTGIEIKKRISSKAKPKVYLGVKVKVTVKELLEQKRANEAVKNCSASQENKLQYSDSVPPSPECYSACAPISSIAEYPQTTPILYYGPQEEGVSIVDQQTLNHYSQPDTLMDNSICDFQNIFPTFPEESIQSFPIFNQSMTPQSPSESSERSNSFEYSPTCQVMECIPPSYSSPSLDTRSCAYAGMNQHVYQHQDNSTYCYCAYCCSMDYQAPVKEQNSYSYTDMDYMEFLTSSEDIFTRDLSNYDMCYI
ncbi:POU class 2 homeobox associating factor 3 [Gastrophryne carolinensis]